MVKFEDTDKPFTYLGLEYSNQTRTFRIKDIQKAIELATEWMQMHYKDRFIRFELYNNDPDHLVARLKDQWYFDRTHINDACSIQKIGRQYRVFLHYRKAT